MVLISTQGAWSRETQMVDSIPVHVISTEEIQKSSVSNLDDLIKDLPLVGESNLNNEDINQAQFTLRGLGQTNVSPSRHVDIQLTEYMTNSNSDLQSMIDALEVIKSNAKPLYGSDALAGLISSRIFNMYPNELPQPSSFLSQEIKWQEQNIPFGRIGLTQNKDRFEWGLSTYNKKDWQWQSSYGLGESYGINGPLVVLGKTPQGPAFSFYSPEGDFVGDVNKIKLSYDPSATHRCLLRGSCRHHFEAAHSYDRLVPVTDFNPYGVIILPYGRTLGDTFQTANILNNRLNNFDNYDASMSSLDGGCVAPHGRELVFPRTVLRAKTPAVLLNPNDPLYPTPNVKKKLKGGITGLIGNVLTIGGEAPMTTTSNKPNVKDQYSLPQIGFTPKSDPHSAWNLVDTKGPNVLVAVIDSGLDLAHPDGPEFIWQNTKEVPNNNIDDDQNGYVDDVHGWNFLDENADVKDLRGHGSIVSGIIAAKMNNGQGIAGINPGAVIMPLKVADSHGNTNSLNIYRAIHYAVRAGAKIINISLGARGVSHLEELAINYARARNVLVVIASGNNNDDLAIFGPSSLGGALAVGALNFDGSRSTVSNWGANNSLMAPGEEILSLHSKDAPWDGPSGQRDRSYTKESGTSFSAPMVAATASLLLVKNPQLSANQLEDILISSAKPLDENRWNGRTGAGLLDAARALSMNPQDSFNIKITKLKKVYADKKLDYVDVYATVRGAVDYFTVEVGKGKNARSFKPVIGIAAQQASDDLVAHITNDHLRGSDEWVVLVHAFDKSGKEYRAQTVLKLK